MNNTPEHFNLMVNLKGGALLTVTFMFAGIVIKVRAICSCFSNLAPSSNEFPSLNITSNNPWTPCGLKSCFVRRKDPVLRTWAAQGADMIVPRADIVCAGDKLRSSHLMLPIKINLDIQLQ